MVTMALSELLEAEPRSLLPSLGVRSSTWEMQ